MHDDGCFVTHEHDSIDQILFSLLFFLKKKEHTATNSLRTLLVQSNPSCLEREKFGAGPISNLHATPYFPFSTLLEFMHGPYLH